MRTSVTQVDMYVRYEHVCCMLNLKYNTNNANNRTCMTRVDMYVGWGRDRILSQILLAPVTHQPSCLLIILLLGKIYFVMVLVLVKWSMFCKYKVFNTTVCIFRCRQSSDQIQALQWSAIKSLIQVLIKCSKPGLHNSWCWRSLKQNDAQIVTEESRQQLNYWPEHLFAIAD